MADTSNSPNVVGLDTAADRWHAVGLDWQPAACTLNSKHKRWKSADVRRAELHRTAAVYFSLLPPGTHVFAEMPLALRNGQTTVSLALASGAIWAAHVSHDIWWHWVRVQDWKLETVGHGNASKDDVAQWVREHLDLDFQQQDYFDAACLREVGLRSLRGIE